MNDDIRIAANGCPVCGYADHVSLSEGCTSFEICVCCGAQAGYTYGEVESASHLESVRDSWLKLECGEWWSKGTRPPEGWSGLGQIIFSGIPISKHSLNLARANEKDEMRSILYLARLLWDDFDPISVQPYVNDPEYNSYIKYTAKLLAENADSYKFTKYIQNSVWVDIGMSLFPNEKIDAFAKRLVAAASKYHRE